MKRIWVTLDLELDRATTDMEMGLIVLQLTINSMSFSCFLTMLFSFFQRTGAENGINEKILDY
jgi:hypothetical protein